MNIQEIITIRCHIFSLQRAVLLVDMLVVGGYMLDCWKSYRLTQSSVVCGHFSHC